MPHRFVEEPSMVTKRSILSVFRRKTQKAISERGVHGEGNYAATRAYNKATRHFVTSGRVDEAARSAAPRDDQEARSMAQAEQAGAERSKGEDPAVTRGRSRTRGKRSG